jgi:hypothetical protein
MAPGYEVAMSVDSGAGYVSISPAATGILDIYGITKVVSGFLPIRAAMFFAAGSMVNALADEVAAARNCLSGANVFKKVWCSAVFVTTATGSVGKFVATAGIDGLEEAPAEIVSGLWGLLQEGTYIGDVASAVFAPGSTSISVSAAPASTPTPTPTPGKPTSPGSPAPPVTTPAPTGPVTPAPSPSQTWPEQETPNHPVNTFTDYHNASGMGPAIAAGQWVEVSCKVYDPTIQSVNPDGYWYRIASAPWSNAYYSPANTFMNGDPYGGPYTHNTDFSVPNC